MSNGIVTDPRKMEGGSIRSQLRKFRGRLKEYNPVVRQSREGGEYTVVELDFTEVEVLASTEPYPFPTAKIEVPYKAHRNSKWGQLTRTALDQGMLFDQLVGRMAEYEVDFQRDLGFIGRDGNPAKTDCWIVTGILDGEVAEAVNVEEVALALLDGKTFKEFTDLALAETAIRTDTTIYSQIATGSWPTSMVNAGKAVLGEDGVYSVT